MPVIELITKIDAPVEICFDLARSIDLHTHSVSQTHEKAVAGVVSGLIGKDEWVTWRAKHFGLWLSLTSQITAFDQPLHFRDSMKSGPFRHFDHDHFFLLQNGNTIMRDVFEYSSPYGPLGHLADALFLKKYMTALLSSRNLAIKNAAETNPNIYLAASKL